MDLGGGVGQQLVFSRGFAGFAGAAGDWQDLELIDRIVAMDVGC